MPAQGLDALRTFGRIARFASGNRGVRAKHAKSKVSSDEVVVVPGGKPIIFFTILALVDEGDEVIYPEPWLPDLRVDDPLRRRTRGADPVCGKT